MSEKPKCIIITGRPGSGKSTLSKELAKLLNTPVISRDEIKEGYVNTFGICHDELPPDSNRIVTGTFFDTVEFLLASKVSLIAEAAFQHSVWQSKMDALTSAAKVCIVICSVESETAAHRYLQRGLNDPNREFYHGDAPMTGYDPPAFELPTIEVSTLDGYSPTLDSVRDFIAAS